MDDPAPSTLLAGIGVLILGSFFLSFSEASLVAVSRVRVRRLVAEGDRRARAVARLIESPTFISAIIVANNILVISISCLATLLVRHSESLPLGENAIRLIILGVVLVAGEITPKSIGVAYPIAISRRVVAPITALTWLLAPVVSAVTAAGNLVLRGAGVSKLHSGHFVTKDDLRAAIDVGEEEEVLEPDEGEMFDTALAMAETSVRSIMVPRVDVVALDSKATMDEALTAVQDSGFSRIPVYEETIDNIVGILYANDLLGWLRSGTGEGKMAADSAREAIMVPETTPVDEMLRQMRERQVHIAVVIGEQGGTEGIVTIEDILEELVGDIEDEHDTPGKEIRRLSENEALIAPKTRIDEVNEELNAAIPSDEYETIAGYIAGEIGRIPDVGETIRLDGIEVTVQGDKDQPLLLVRVLTDKHDGEGGDS